MLIGRTNFRVDKTHIMGILNVTPDSFSDGGRHNTLENALRHAEKMISEGVDIIDIGGESTRPGHVQISDAEEIERVAPVIEAVSAEFDIPVSVDTYKSVVAKAAIEAGAVLVNDIWGFKYDADMAKTVKDSNTACCLMHNRNNSIYGDFIADVKAELAECVDIAKKAGIADDKIILDPGVGFGKTYEQNLAVIRHLSEFYTGYPMLLGTSRKSVIGIALGLNADQRLEGTIATTVMAVMSGCMFVRVHDVKENKRAADMTAAVLRA